MVIRLKIHFLSAAAFVLILSLLAGCASTARPLMPTPALYHKPPVKALFRDVPQERRRPEVELLYITDRMAEKKPDSELPYGEKRARSLAFGTAVVEMVPALNWSELERQSQLAERSAEVNLEMGRIDELGRFPEEPYALEAIPTGVRRASNVVAAHERSKADFRMEVRRHLAQSRNGEVMLYVHGFNETFATAAYTAAELCHFFGREHACALFTSPDIDTDVARQKIEMFGSDPDMTSRWTGARLPRMIRGRLTIYTSPSDRALLASTILFRSRHRVGRLRPEDVPPAARDYFSKWGNIDLIVYEGKATDQFGHSYFSSNPTVSADLIQLIRYGRAPGETGRPLVQVGAAAWKFP